MRLASRGAESAPELDINRFVLEHGRMPFLSDPVPPWHYRGWLLFQIQMADNHPGATGRWDHYLRTFEAGHLLDEPIPQVQFAATPSPDGVKMLEKCVDLLAYRESHWSAFEALVEWLAWGLAVSRRTPQLEEASSEALYRSFNFEPLLLHPHDYLGHLLSERRGKGWNPHAYFPTPHAVCELMAQITFNGGDGESDHYHDDDPRLRLVCEPAAGTGRMLLHASNFSYRLFGMDIDPTAVTICLCNGAFYAPWLAFPFPHPVLGGARPTAEERTGKAGLIPKKHGPPPIIGLALSRRCLNSIGLQQGDPVAL
jgi:hypothetical protein